MSEKLIAKINGVNVLTIEQDGEVFVPVRPLCEAMGIDFARQKEKIEHDEILASTIGVRPTVAADGKQREMFCIGLRYVYGWLFTINPKNVAPEARETVSRYRRKCYDVLYEHFTGAITRAEEANRLERELMAAVDAAASEEKEARARRKRAEDDLEKLRAERLNPQPSLF